MSEGYGPPAGPGAVPPGHWPPPVVVSAAQQHQFGAHLASRQSPAPSSGALTSALIGVGLLVLGCVVLGLARGADPYGDPSNFTDGGSGGGEGLFWVLRALAGGSCVAAVGFLANAIRSAASRPAAESHYLYEGGIVRFAGGPPETLAWSDVREVRPIVAPEGANAGTVTHYSLVRHRGMPVPVPVTVQHGPDPFAEHLLAVLRSRGITITPARPQ